MLVFHRVTSGWVHVAAAALGIALAGTSLPVAAQSSAFTTVTFNRAVQVDLPRTWAYVDKRIASDMNTSAEALVS